MSAHSSKTSRQSLGAASLDREERYRQVVRILWIILILNWAVAAAKFFYGAATGSLSMRNDGIASAFDGLSNIVGILGVKVASQPPDKAHPYGHAKFETYASLAIGVMLALAAYNLAADGIQALLGHRTEVEVNGGSYLVMVGTLVINLGVSWVEGHYGKRLGSEVLTADALHTRSDAFVTISVILGLLAVSLGYPMADSLVAVIVSVAIAISALEVFREAARTLSDHAVLEVEPLRQVVLEVPGVHSVHHIRTRGTGGDVFVDLHVLVDPAMTVVTAHHISQEVEQAVQQGFPEVSEVMVHIEPDNPQERSEGLADDRALGASEPQAVKVPSDAPSQE